MMCDFLVYNRNFENTAMPLSSIRKFAVFFEGVIQKIVDGFACLA